MPKTKTEPGDRLLIYAKHDGKRKGVIIHTAMLEKGVVEVVRGERTS